jgi:hypothetical protein
MRFTWVGSGLARTHNTKLERPDRDKHNLIGGPAYYNLTLAE